MYLHGNEEEAQRKINEAWRDFTGTKKSNEKGFVFRYFYNTYSQTLSGTYYDRISYIVTAGQGQYYFTNNGWTLDMARENVRKYEASMMYAKGWFEKEYPGRITLICHRPVSDVGIMWGESRNGEVYVFFPGSCSPDNVSYLIAHESVHALINSFNLKTNFPRNPYKKDLNYLEEGLATVIEFQYSKETGVLFEDYLYRLTPMGWEDMSGADTFDDVSSVLNELALFAIDQYDFGDKRTFGEQYAVLQSYFTAASFISYLLEQRGSKDDFFRFYSDIRLADKIYGKDLDGLIEDWLEYLA
jgi:hypothetical protein